MKIDFGDPIDFKIPLAKFPMSLVPIELKANRAAIKVFVLQTAHDQMVEHVNQDKNIECGGILVGYPFQDQEAQETFVVIVGIIPDISSNRSVVHFTVTPDTISRTRQILEKDFPELIAVGWYHSHPGHGVFLSAQDMTIVQGIYSETWNIAWVIDPVRNTEGIFWGADGNPIIANINEHSLLEKNNKIWFSIAKVPQCIIDLQAGKITYREKTPALITHKKIAKNDVVSDIKPYRKEVGKNNPRQLGGGGLFILSMLTLILLCVSLMMPKFLVIAILAGVLSISKGLYVLLRFITNRDTATRNETLIALIMVSGFSFLWLCAFLSSYMGILPPVYTSERTPPTQIPVLMPESITIPYP